MVAEEEGGMEEGLEGNLPEREEVNHIMTIPCNIITFTTTTTTKNISLTYLFTIHLTTLHDIIRLTLLFTLLFLFTRRYYYLFFLVFFFFFYFRYFSVIFYFLLIFYFFIQNNMIILMANGRYIGYI